MPKSSLFGVFTLMVGAAMAVVILPTASSLDSVGQSIHGLAGTIVPLLGVVAAVAAFGLLLVYLQFDTGGM
jgi:hypothetical protein